MTQRRRLEDVRKAGLNSELRIATRNTRIQEGGLRANRDDPPRASGWRPPALIGAQSTTAGSKLSFERGVSSGQSQRVQ